MTRSLVVVLLVCACNRAFDIDTTNLEPDALPPPDTDGDGVFDANDNCPDIANDQTDEDEDGHGDVCDNCPVVANPRQELEGDEDAVGTVCDPRPGLTGDCLVLYDSFADASSFATRWRTLSSGATNPPVITPGPGSVTVDGPTTLPVTLVALDNEGVDLVGLFDVQARGNATLTTGTFGVVSRASDYRTGYDCSIFAAAGSQQVAVKVGSFSMTSSDIQVETLSADPTSPSTLLRLFSPRGSGSNEPRLTCRVEHGLAVGVEDVTLDPTFEPPPGGGPGIRVTGDVVEVLAVAIYRFQTTPCAAPIIR